MRAREFVNEILDVDAPAPVTKWVSGTDTEGNKVSYGQWKDKSGKNIGQEFQRDPAGDVKIDWSRANAQGKPEYGVTGTGQGKQVSTISGVTQNVRDYIKNNPDFNQLKFSSSADSRTGLYNRIVDRLAPQMGLVGSAAYDPDLQRTNYTLRKAQPGEVHNPISAAKIKSGGGSGGAGVADTRDMQMGADLDPKAMMMRSRR
jgi:hypothetical protein